MTPVCVVVVASLCALKTGQLTQFAVNHYDGILYGSATIWTNDWRVETTTYSDCINCGPKSQFVNLCVEGECINYHRQCDDAKRPTVCGYHFDMHAPVTVMAKTSEAYQDAVSAVALAPTNPSVPTRFPLSVFNKEASGPPRTTPLRNYLRDPPTEEGPP